MTLTIRNNINQNLKIKISKCIELLGNEYMNLDFTIDFYKERERLEIERRKKPILKEDQYEQILNGLTETSGITIGDQRKIKIFLFLFDLENDPNEILNLVGNIYHEIRHAWQITNNLFTEEEEIVKVDGNFDTYLSLPSEKDAYSFQYQEMKKHANMILRIFGINKRVQEFRLNEKIMNAIK